MPPKNARILATNKKTGAAVPLMQAARVILPAGKVIPWKYLQVEQFEFDAPEKSDITDITLRQPLIAMMLSKHRLRMEFENPGGAKKISYNEGDQLIHPAGPLVPFRPLGPASFFVASFENKLLDQLTSNQNQAQSQNQSITELLAIPKTDDAFIRIALYTLKTEVELGCPGGRMYGDSIAAALAAHLIAKYSSGPGQADMRGGLNRKTLRVVTEFIEDNFHRELSLDELAALVYMSPYHFLRMFKQSTGLTPFQYLLNCRIVRAKELLSSGNQQVKQVAHEVGFSNQSHFTRQFKKFTGVNPLVYMNERR